MSETPTPEPTIAEKLKLTDDQLNAHHHATTAMVLVNYLREVGVDFNAERTALEADTFFPRFEQAEYEMLLSMGIRRDEISVGVQDGDSWPSYRSALIRILPVQIGRNFGLDNDYREEVYFLAGMSRFDHNRIIEALTNLSTRDKGIIATASYRGEPRTKFLPSKDDEPELYTSSGTRSYPNWRKALTIISQKLADIVKENVLITMKPGRSIKYVTGIRDGVDKRVSTLSGNIPGADSLALTEKMIEDEGIQIRHIDAADATGDNATAIWFSVRNSLSGRNIIFKQIGTSYKVIVRPGTTNMSSFTGHHLKSGNFKVSVEKVESE